MHKLSLILALINVCIYSSLMNPLQLVPGPNTQAPTSAMARASQIQPIPLQPVRPLNGIPTPDQTNNGESASSNTFVRRMWADGYPNEYDYDYGYGGYGYNMPSYRFNSPYFGAY
jgi:hypothetical protein